MYFSKMALDLEEVVEFVLKVLSLICMNERNIESVEQFIYLRSVVSAHGG